jgi:hypothetical protein
VLGLLLLGLPASAFAAEERQFDERYDHRGAVGLLFGSGGAGVSLGATTPSLFGLRWTQELGGTYAIDVNGNELVLVLRGSIVPEPRIYGLAGGYRGYFGYQRVKTFIDLQVAAYVSPTFLIGPRVGAGVQFELSPIAGLFVGGAVNLGFGNGLLLSGELIAGLQLRSYLLE